MKVNDYRYSTIKNRTHRTVFDFGDWDITLREIVFSFLIIGIMTTIGFFISLKIEKTKLDNTLKYRQSAQISTTNEFIHAINTDVGYAFVEGELQTIDPVKDKNLKGEWLSITSYKEHYTLHTQVYVTYDNKGRPHSHIRTYWTWDVVDSNNIHANNVIFCGVPFKYSTFKYDDAEIHTYVHKIDSHNRIVFKSIPKTFNATIFENISHTNKLKNVILYCNKTINTVYNDLTTSHSVTIFWIIWSIITLIFVIAFYIIDNDWLEDDINSYSRGR